MRKYKKVYYVENEADLRKLLEELDQLGHTWLSGDRLSPKSFYTKNILDEEVQLPIAICIGKEGKAVYIHAEDEETKFTLDFLKRLEGGEVEYYGDIEMED